MKTKWKNLDIVFSGSKCMISGLNIWDFKWEYTGEIVGIKDPQYKQSRQLLIYNIVKDDIRVRFGACEFSNGVWGIYIEKKCLF